MDAYLLGQITLGELEGVTKEQQYEIAKLGHAELVGGKLDEAKTIFDGLLALDPFDAYFLSALGSIAHQKGDFEEAEARYSRALEINPFSPFALAHRGEVRISTGAFEAGVDDLLRALEEDPEGADPAVRRAKATITILVEQLRDAGIEASELEDRAAAVKTNPKVAKVPIDKPKVPQLDADQLRRFAEESEMVVVRRNKEGGGPQTAVVRGAPEDEPSESSEPPERSGKTATVPTQKAQPKRPPGKRPPRKRSKKPPKS
jgi:tetratricopeptide (TPR) repeat protein